MNDDTTNTDKPENDEIDNSTDKNDNKDVNNKSPDNEDNTNDDDNQTTSDNDDDDEEDENIDDGHPRLITTERTSLIPQPRSAALLASENDVFEFQSSPEDEPTTSTPQKKYKKSPVSLKKAKEEQLIDDDEDESKLQIDEEDETMDIDETEKKKVPPLRIMLTKTPSDDEEPPQEELKLEEKPTPTRKAVKGKKKESANSSRMTRARLRQATEEGTPAKRRTLGRIGSTLIAAAEFDEDYSLSPGLGLDEDSQEGETRKMLPPAPPPVRAWELVQEDFKKGRMGLRKLILDRYKQLFERSLKVKPEEPEIPNYDLFMINVKDYFVRDDNVEFPEHPIVKTAPKVWPAAIKKIWLKHERARKVKQIEHEKERVRLQTFGEREYLRAVRSTLLRERNELSIMKILRDEDTCNPIVFDSFRPEPEVPSMIPPSVEEIIERFIKLAENLENKQMTEVRTMHYLQKNEMEECLRDVGYITDDQEISKEAIPMLRVETVPFDYLVKIDAVDVPKPEAVLPPPDVIQKYGLDNEKIDDTNHETTHAHLIPTNTDIKNEI